MLTAEQLAALDARLRANADKLIRKAETILYTKKEGKAGRKPAFFFNCVQPECYEVLTESEGKWPLWLDDVLSGVARLDWYGQKERNIPLSAKNMLKCFAMLDRIDAYEISQLLIIGERQAQRYLKACELAHPWLIKGWCDDELRGTHYPETFIYPRARDLAQSDIGEY